MPFFIPMPTLIGTMGAVILIRSRIRSRTALFDIGIAGPIAGFVVALGVLAASLAWSKPLHGGTSAAEYGLGYPLIFHAMHRLMASANLLRGAAALPLNLSLIHICFGTKTIFTILKKWDVDDETLTELESEST